MADRLLPDDDHPIDVQTVRRSGLAVTRLRCDTGLRRPSAPIAPERAFVINLQLRDIPFHELWFDGAPAPTAPYPKHGVSVFDLEHKPTVFLPTPFDCLQFYLSREVLDDLADEHNCRRIQGLHWRRGEIDPVIEGLGRAFLPALGQPSHANALFLDHAALALTNHIAHAYGGMHPVENKRGGLAPWQERRSKELMNSCIENDVSLGELATECRLSRSYFARAFKKSTGQSPHRWLLERRVQCAKDMLLHSEEPLSEIALSVGFSDQSHLTKVFSRTVGATPGAWRRSLKDASRPSNVVARRAMGSLAQDRGNAPL